MDQQGFVHCAHRSERWEAAPRGIERATMVAQIATGEMEEVYADHPVTPKATGQSGLSGSYGGRSFSI